MRELKAHKTAFNTLINHIWWILRACITHSNCTLGYEQTVDKNWSLGKAIVTLEPK